MKGDDSMSFRSDVRLAMHREAFLEVKEVIESSSANDTSTNIFNYARRFRETENKRFIVEDWDYISWYHNRECIKLFYEALEEVFVDDCKYDYKIILLNEDGTVEEESNYDLHNRSFDTFFETDVLMYVSRLVKFSQELKDVTDKW